MSFKQLSVFNKFIVILNGVFSLLFISQSGRFLINHPRLFHNSPFDFFSAIFALLGSTALAVNVICIFLKPRIFPPNLLSFSRWLSLAFGIYLSGATLVGLVFSFGLPAGDGPDFLTGLVILLAMFFISGCIFLGAILQNR